MLANVYLHRLDRAWPRGLLRAEPQHPLEAERRDAVLWVVRCHAARNQVVSGVRVAWKIVPAVAETS